MHSFFPPAKTLALTLALGVSASLGGCGDEGNVDDDAGNAGGVSQTGGAAPATGGTIPVGGQPGVGGTATGAQPPATGGAPPATGGMQPATGGEATGGAPPSTGGSQSSTGGQEQSTGGSEAGTGGTQQGTGGDQPGTGGIPPATGGQDTGGSPPATGGQPTGGAPATGGVSGGEVLSETFTGDATYYNGSGVVNCSYEGITDGDLIAALNAQQYGTADWCGACAEVEGPNGSVSVMVVDQCPECAHGDLDLSPTAFNQIAEQSAGRVTITWNFVSCSNSGPITYRYKDGVNQWHVELLIENHNLPVESVEWSKDQVSWTMMTPQTYNFFIESNGFGAGQTYVRVTSITGAQLTDVLPEAQPYLTVQGTANF